MAKPTSIANRPKTWPPHPRVTGPETPLLLTDSRDRDIGPVDRQHNLGRQHTFSVSHSDLRIHEQGEATHTTPHTTNIAGRDRVPLGIINDLQAPHRAQPSRLPQVADEADLAPSTASLSTPPSPPIFHFLGTKFMESPEPKHPL